MSADNRIQLQTYSQADSLAISQILYALAYFRLFSDIKSYPLVKFSFPICGMILAYFTLFTGSIQQARVYSVPCLIYAISVPFLVLIYWEFVAIDAKIGSIGVILGVCNSLGVCVVLVGLVVGRLL
ncbi:Transmembrane domain-containing protein [Spironucleus salmonicida]|uniref:Transmembrane domain-containing protein n=1 Tax=Spironucleus salmonicida TaxID=348837 RepID=V6LJ73_9EUKA|nr:Transmembrane domain-containing protein [Spironucleus salmonicida]|eukprot:EST44398.1 Transmembrane domain-containing protein [Spironucleus salmonicida]